ncbi:MAG TPA: PEGA domain-containing protein [Candidatus Saccharimonadales bacterium]|nr:PEGA domain-containing protein [Candidatus Saccharimonadales bacterium]
MKRAFFILIIAIVLGVLSFGIFQYFFNSGSQKGALQVTSNPESKVYLNDRYMGQTPLCKCELRDMQKSGDYTIRLTPLDKNLSEFQEKITITKGVLTVVDRKFGRGSDSSGSVISLTPLNDNKSAELLVVSIPSKSKILLDNYEIGESPILFRNPTESDHLLQITQEGYEEKTIRIRTPLGYKLTVTAFLNTSNSQDNLASQSASLAPSAAPTQPQAKVVILDTPTGFLRVRESATIGSVEVARVNPTEEYGLVSEQEGWFEIKLKDGQNGWISSQYAKKQ